MSLHDSYKAAGLAGMSRRHFVRLAKFLRLPPKKFTAHKWKWTDAQIKAVREYRRKRLKELNRRLYVHE